MSKLNLDEIPLSSYLINKHFRLLNNIKSRINALEFQKNYLIKNKKSVELPDTQYIQALIRCSKHIKILNWIKHRLVVNSLICNKPYWYSGYYRQFNKFPKKVQDHSIEVLGIFIPKKLNLYTGLNRLKANYKALGSPKHSNILDLIEKEENRIKLIEKLIENMKISCIESRKTELKARLLLEAKYRVSQGWYCIFDTLTVKEHMQNDVFKKGSTIWTDYIRKIDRVIGITLHGDWRTAVAARAAGDEFHVYFAVVERGHKKGTPHYHVLHFMKVLPYGCSDPNSGRSRPFHREIQSFKKYWRPYGFSTPIAVRFNNSDAYANDNWVFPIEKDTGLAIKCGSPEQIIGYITKYIQKSYDERITRKEGFTQWRTKMSQSIGKNLSKKIMQNLTMLQCELILRIRSRKYLQFQNENLPLWTLKKLAMKKILNKKNQQTPKKLWIQMTQLKPRDSFLKRVNAMIQKKESPNIVNFTLFRTMNLLVQVGSSLNKKINEILFDILGNAQYNTHIRGNSLEVS